MYKNGDQGHSQNSGKAQGGNQSRAGPCLGGCSLHLYAPWAQRCQFMDERLTFWAQNKAGIAEFQTFLKRDLVDGHGSQEGRCGSLKYIALGLTFILLHYSLEKVLREPLSRLPHGSDKGTEVQHNAN